MTIPIVPGPFQFLAEAGQAAGSVGEALEQRKERHRKMAEAGISELMKEILAGKKPASALDTPEIRKLSKMAYGVEIPSIILPQPQEDVAARQSAAIRAAPPGSAQDRAITGVPSEKVAKAGESQQIVKGRKADAELERGVPELEADVERLQTEAAAAGHQFNANIYKTALAMLGTDPVFKRRAVEAATGVMDYKLRLLMLRRESLSLERQHMLDDANLTRSLMVEADKFYAQVLKTWETNKQLSGDAGDYEKKTPQPNQEEVVADFIKRRTGLSMDQFRTHARTAIMGVLQEEGEPAEGGAKGGGDVAPGAEKNFAPPSDAQKISKRLSTSSPEDAAAALAELVETNDLTELQAGATVQLLGESTPGRWFKKFNSLYGTRRLGGKPRE